MVYVSRGLDAPPGLFRESPRDSRRVVLTACRPAAGVLELPAGAVLDREAGLAGDNWQAVRLRGQLQRPGAWPCGGSTG